MIKTRRTHLMISLLSLLLVLALAACGSASANSATIQTTTVPAASVTTAAPTSAAVSSGSTTSAATASKLNLNTASEQDFLTIPGVGSRMVREFLEYRPYTTLQQFEREIGKYVSAAQMAEYEKYVYVPISANDSDAATLMQIPGLDESEATALIAGRPYASNDAFLASLAPFVSADQLATAQAYLNN